MNLKRPHYFLEEWINREPLDLAADVLVYGGNAAGVVAAVELARRNHRVILCHPGRHLGGLTSGGLGYTDFGNRSVVGGLAREFYRAVGARYRREECFSFEPHVAEEIFEAWVDRPEIRVVRCAFLESVEMRGHRIGSARFRGGLRVTAESFIDTTYEGDLMAAAGVSYVVGRESNSEFGETRNGSQIHSTHQFPRPVDPYRIRGNPESGLLSGVEGEAVEEGKGDHRVQAYNFRVCMTDDPEIRIPFPRPDSYDPNAYELAARFLEGVEYGKRPLESLLESDRIFQKFDRLTLRGKTDTNNHGPVSTDFIGGSWAWPEAGFEERESLFQRHVAWQQGLHYFMANDERVPEPVRKEYARWGLAKDEFLDTGHWPHQLYVREARRMRGEIVVDEAVCEGRRAWPDVAAMGAYQMDSHHVRRVVMDGRVQNEGDVQKPIERPYGIPYLAMIPRRGECENLAVPVCVSATHVAYGSIRMEPVFMSLSQSAAIGVSLAMERSTPLRDSVGEPLRRALLAAGQVLATDAKNEGYGNP